VRIAFDYRPALRDRTGVGEYIHRVAAALAQAGGDEITLFSSSWKDRVPAETRAEFPHARIVDCRIPVSALNLSWHRLGWPPVEALAGDTFDVAHSPHPLLLPSRAAAAIVTIHDLHFLSHPERTSREIRRDYPALTKSHAQRADRIIVSSRFAAGEVQRRLDVPAEKIAVCPAGAPEWRTAPAETAPDRNRYILFMGTLDPRKNLGGLLDAYSRLLGRPKDAPRLVVAGGAGPDSEKWLAALKQPPLEGHVEYLGYVKADDREALVKGALMFVLPSFEEGFGLPALEAMAAGVPVIVSRRGSLPEVVGDAGLLIEPDDPESLADAMIRMAADPALRATCRERGLTRAGAFRWTDTARAVRRAYEEAIDHRRLATGHPGSTPGDRR
jgi:glycosyltransferase involved in cell wall biosynthesis